MSQTPASEHGSGLEATPARDPATTVLPPLAVGDQPAEDQPAAAPLAVEPTPADLAATADPRVDDALSRLAEVETLPLAEQVAVYADIHRRLAGVLSDPDSQA